MDIQPSSHLLQCVRAVQSWRSLPLWGIETNMLIEKHQGYNYEHRFSFNWNAMKGFHYLMRMAHMLNAIALCTKAVAQQVKRIGVQSFLRLVRESCANCWLSLEWIQKFIRLPYQLRLV